MGWLGFKSNSKSAPVAPVGDNANQSLVPENVPLPLPDKHAIASLVKSGEFSSLDKGEITRLAKRFNEYREESTGRIPTGIVCRMPEFGMNVFVRRLCEGMVEGLQKEANSDDADADADADANANADANTDANVNADANNEEEKKSEGDTTTAVGSVNGMSFVEFLRLVSLLSPKTPKEKKVKHLFQSFASKKTGVMTITELYEYFTFAMNGGSGLLPAVVIRKIAEDALLKYGRPDPGLRKRVVGLEEFTRAVDADGVAAKMTVHY